MSEYRVGEEEDHRSAAERYVEAINHKAYLEGRVKLNNRSSIWELDDEGNLIWNFHEGQMKVMESTKRIIVALGGRQSGKCLAMSSPIAMGDGSLKKIGDVQPGERVVSFCDKTHKVSVGTVLNKFDTGVKPVFKVVTCHGSEIEATEEHKFFAVVNGKQDWVKLKDLKEGDFIATPRRIPEVATGKYPKNLLRVMGYLIADGALSNKGGVELVKGNRRIVADFEASLPDDCVMTKRTGISHGVAIRSENGERVSDRNSMVRLTEEWGIRVKSNHKVIPDFVFTLRNEYVAEMLNALLTSDGWVDKRGFGICLSSKKLIYQIRHLLLRFGVLSRVRYKQVKLNDKLFDSWLLTVLDLDSLIRLRDDIGLLSDQEKLCALIEKKLSSSRPWNTKDYVPGFPREECKAAREPGDKDGYALLRSSRKGVISRRGAQRFAQYFGVGHKEAYSDIYWVQIRSIEPIGEEATCDIEVEGTHSYVASDLIVHNSESGPPWLYEEMKARGPGWYMVVAPTYPILEDSALPKFESLFINNLNLGVIRQAPLRFLLSPDGERALWGHANLKRGMETTVRFGHGTSPSSLEAKTSMAAWVDEGGQPEFKKESYEAIEGRHTTTLGRLLITTTPYDLGTLKTRFFDPVDEYKKRGEDHPDIDIISWSSTINPNFPREEYERLKGTMPAWRHAMFYDGIFSIPSGLIYSVVAEKDDQIRVAPFEIPEHWPRFAGVDFGGTNTAALYAALDQEEGVLYLYDTYVPGVAKRIRDHAWSIMEKAGIPLTRVAGGAKSEGQWREEFLDSGMYIEEPAIADVAVGIARAYSLLSAGRIRIFSNEYEPMVPFWDEINDYKYKTDPHTGEVLPGLEIRDKNKYHLMDSMRYLCSMFPELERRGAMGHVGVKREPVDAGLAIEELPEIRTPSMGRSGSVGRRGRVWRGSVIGNPISRDAEYARMLRKTR